MSESRYIDITSVDGQAALLAQTQQAISNIGATAAPLPDDSGCVWVNIGGAVLDIELDDTSRRLHPDELARLITATARQAVQNAAQRVADECVDAYWHDHVDDATYLAARKSHDSRRHASGATGTAP